VSQIVGGTDVPGRSSVVASSLVTRTKRERSGIDQHYTFVGEREHSSAGMGERRCNARSICYDLPLRMIPSNTARLI
jgi:hypothetical protein